MIFSCPRKEFEYWPRMFWHLIKVRGRRIVPLCIKCKAYGRGILMMPLLYSAACINTQKQLDMKKAYCLRPIFVTERARLARIGRDLY